LTSSRYPAKGLGFLVRRSLWENSKDLAYNKHRRKEGDSGMSKEMRTGRRKRRKGGVEVFCERIARLARNLSCLKTDNLTEKDREMVMVSLVSLKSECANAIETLLHDRGY